MSLAEPVPAVDAHCILLVDDSRRLSGLLSERLASASYSVKTVTSAEQALTMVPALHPQLVITNLPIDEKDGMNLFKQLHALSPELPIVALMACGATPDAIKAPEHGTVHHLAQPLDGAALVDHIARTMEMYTAPQGAGVCDDWCKPIITRNRQMKKLLAEARRAAPFDVSVLIQSESGTGKELLAHAIHRASHRAQRPFVALNCSAVPEELLESELFGHTKGAFTGAVREHKGMFQAACGGTLFLDEIGDMPLAFQAKLLRAIQEKEVRPVGSTHSVPVDVRILAATHRKLTQEIAHKRFREDLFYRLNVIPLRIPPLRDRLEDVPLLANGFLEEFQEEYGNRECRHFSTDAMAVLMAQSWPGNVRELRNVVERTAVLSTTSIVDAGTVRSALANPEDNVPSLTDARRHCERRYLVRLLQMTAGNITRAAELAQRNRTEVYKLLTRHGIDPAEFRDARAA